MSDAILVINAGPTDLKFATYGVDAAKSPPLLCGGRIDSMQGDPHFVVKNATGKPLVAHEWGEGHAIDHKAAEHFVYAMTKFAGAYAAVLGGLDAFVFTAGISENSAPVRATLCDKLTWLGVKLDAPANTAGGPCISAPDSSVSAWVIPTNEELMIAQHTLAIVRA